MGTVLRGIVRARGYGRWMLDLSCRQEANRKKSLVGSTNIAEICQLYNLSREGMAEKISRRIDEAGRDLAIIDRSVEPGGSFLPRDID